MAKQLTKELANIIAHNYTTNGHKKGKALFDAGYSLSYSKGLGLKIYDNDLVKQALRRIETLNQINTSLTQEEVMADLKYGLDRAKEKDDLPMIARFAELRGKTLAMFKDKVIQEEDIETPTPEEADRISLERRESIRLQQQSKDDAG